MTQFLITTFTDRIGHTHYHVTKAKDNQTFTVVEAEKKEGTELKARVIQDIYKRC
ncbi:DUF1381 domain-containing protein [Staphylococcus gallinarum]|uniref:DUF1381 domain-containing protein n=1 Tax=Staphylococcus gallinarum TaxID=1293 RepID=A0ABQ0XYX8_STAGA|nr:DUF1381 domain-containing protein [Staphylococcus gallinarum]MCD8910390.1 DUF1381 domain-containing protein [Staphylococcus gallinarum]RTX76632.1 DUF1381 domain-containing protein [Staphylococcus gallinarum]GEQ04593.1 hypothetical protein SGA02_04210 [Staphylococcus gallinarum]